MPIVKIILYRLNLFLTQNTATLLYQLQVHLPIRAEVFLALHYFLDYLGVELVPLLYGLGLVECFEQSL